MSGPDDHHQGGVPAGVAIALLSATLFGASTPIAKLLVGTIDPWMLAALLYLGSGLGLFVIRMMQRMHSARAEAPVAGTGWLWFGGAIFSGGVVGPVLLMTGLA